ncbi:hypothetical protein ACR3K2_19360 [Cryptosporidium serpentis]
MATYYADYPVFGLCCADKEIIVSGGGGGKEYGIEDQLEVFDIVDKNDKKVQLTLSSNNKFSVCSSLALRYLYSTTKQNGIVDGMSYNSTFQIVAGGIKNTCILFSLSKEKNDTQIEIHLQFQSVWDSKTKGKQNISRFSTDGKLLLTAGTDGIVRVWTLKLTGDKSKIKPESVEEYFGHDQEVLDVDITLDNSYIISASRNGNVLVHDCSTRQIIKQFTVPMKNSTYIVRQCRFIKDIGKSIQLDEFKQYKVSLLIHELRGSSFLTLWNMKIPFTDKNSSNRLDVSLMQLSSIFVNDKPSSIMTISTDHQYFAVGTNSGSVYLIRNYNNDFKWVQSFYLHDLPVTGLQFFNSTDYIISSGADYTIGILATNTGSNNSTHRKLFKFIKYILLITVFLLAFTMFVEYCINIGYKTNLKHDIERLHSYSAQVSDNEYVNSTLTQLKNEL